MSFGGSRGGWSWSKDLVTRSIMEDLQEQPTLHEQLFLGVNKALQGVTYSHYDYRNVKRSFIGTQGRVS